MFCFQIMEKMCIVNIVYRVLKKMKQQLCFLLKKLSSLEYAQQPNMASHGFWHNHIIGFINAPVPLTYAVVTMQSKLKNTNES